MELEVISRNTHVMQKYLNEKDVKETSRKLYVSTLRRYGTFLKARGIDILNTHSADLIAFRESISALAPKSVNAYLSVIKDMYVYLHEMQMITHNPYTRHIKGMKVSKVSSKAPLSVHQMQLFLTTAQTLLNARDYAILNLIARTGLRTIEVTRMRVCDIQMRGGKQVVYVKGKGCDAYDAYVILTPEAYGPILTYLQTRGAMQPEGPLFVSESNNNTQGAISTCHIRNIGRTVLREIGVHSKAVTVHSLRHTVATQILMNGGNTDDVKNTLRHANIATSEIYLHTVADQMRLDRYAEGLISKIY